jgi:hypothetical protein
MDDEYVMVWSRCTVAEFVEGDRIVGAKTAGN